MGTNRYLFAFQSKPFSTDPTPLWHGLIRMLRRPHAVVPRGPPPPYSPYSTYSPSGSMRMPASNATSAMAFAGNARRKLGMKPRK